MYSEVDYCGLEGAMCDCAGYRTFSHPLAAVPWTTFLHPCQQLVEQNDILPVVPFELAPVPHNTAPVCRTRASEGFAARTWTSNMNQSASVTMMYPGSCRVQIQGRLPLKVYSTRRMYGHRDYSLTFVLMPLFQLHA